MPVLALLLRALLLRGEAVAIALWSTDKAVRMAAVMVLVAAYIACVVFFTNFIKPLIASLFSTSYGHVIGLAFPPIAGTVLAGVIGLWGCIVVKRYYFKFTKIMVK